MRGIKHQELQSILQFMYLGEVTIARDRIDQFMEIAKDLQLSGGSDEEESKIHSETSVDESDTVIYKEEPRDSDSNEAMGNDKPLTLKESLEERNSETFLTPSCEGDPAQEYSVHINKECKDKLKEEFSQMEQNCSGRVSKEFNDQFETSDICNDFDQSKSYGCQECKITFPLKRYFTDHLREKHDGLYSCKHCEYKTPTVAKLKRHQGYKHGSVKYLCDLM